MTPAQKRFPGATPEYVAFADSFFERLPSDSFGESDFWKLIDRCRAILASISREDTKDPTWDTFRTEIFQLTPEELYFLDDIYTGFYVQLNTREIWSAIGYTWGGVSDDSFMDFKEWVLTCGRSAFERVVGNPDCIPQVITEYCRSSPFAEGVLCYNVKQAFEEKTGFEIPSYKSYDFSLRGEWIEEDDLSIKLPNCFRNQDLWRTHRGA